MAPGKVGAIMNITNTKVLYQLCLNHIYGKDSDLYKDININDVKNAGKAIIEYEHTKFNYYVRQFKLLPEDEQNKILNELRKRMD